LPGQAAYVGPFASQSSDAQLAHVTAQMDGSRQEVHRKMLKLLTHIQRFDLFVRIDMLKVTAPVAQSRGFVCTH